MNKPHPPSHFMLWNISMVFHLIDSIRVLPVIRLIKYYICNLHSFILFSIMIVARIPCTMPPRGCIIKEGELLFLLFAGSRIAGRRLKPFSYINFVFDELWILYRSQPVSLP